MNSFVTVSLHNDRVRVSKAAEDGYVVRQLLVMLWLCNMPDLRRHR